MISCPFRRLEPLGAEASTGAWPLGTLMMLPPCGGERKSKSTQFYTGITVIFKTPPSLEISWLAQLGGGHLHTVTAPVSECFLQCPVSGLGVVFLIPGKRRTFIAAEERSNPGIFIAKSPGLKSGAAVVRQANSGDLAIDIRLPSEVFRIS